MAPFQFVILWYTFKELMEKKNQSTPSSVPVQSFFYQPLCWRGPKFEIFATTSLTPQLIMGDNDRIFW